MSKPEDWTQDQFYTFILIHAAHADLEICDTERSYISNKFGEEHFLNIENNYYGMGEYERLETILSCKTKFYNNKASKAKLLDEMHKMFKFDGAYTKLEKNTLLREATIT